MSELTPEQEAAIQAFMNDLEDMVNSTGAHAGHSLQQVGRCVYCSCGQRYQGRLPKK
jgi:hypothetical protein